MNEIAREGQVVPPVTGTQIAEFSRTDQALALLGERLTGITYDFSKSSELGRAIKDRAEVRGYRTDLERTRKLVKEDALARCRLIDGEAKRIEDRLRDLEDPINEQIKAEEQRKERERQERENRERERVAEIQNRIAWFALTASSSAGMASADVLGVIQSVEQLEVDASYGEFQDQGRGAKERALTMLRQMHAGALSLERAKAEEEAAAKRESERLAIERAELDRRRAEQEEREREERERQARMAAEDTARRAKIEAEEREHRERLAAEERAAREKREHEERAARDRFEAEEAERRAYVAEESKRQAAEAKRLADERRALELESQELADAQTILRRFLERFGRRKEFAGVVAAIKDYFEQRGAEVKK